MGRSRLVRLPYNIALHALFPVLLLLAAGRHRRRRGAVGDLLRRLGLTGREAGRPPRGALWIQAVSVGEVAAARPLVTLLRETVPDPLFLTVTTATGFRVARRQFPGLAVGWFPFDLPLVWQRFLAVRRPRLFIAMETELWPNLLAALAGRGIPFVVLNGRLSERSYRRYRRMRFMLRPLLARGGWFGMRGEREAAWIRALGAPAGRVTVTGNIKYDQALRLTESVVPAVLGGRDGDGPLLLFASLHPGEEEVTVAVARTLKREFPGLKFVFAPRHPERGRLFVRLMEAGLPACFLSRFRPPLAATALVVDVMGRLAEFYPLAAGVFVGGSLVAAGGQNMLEPAAFGRPVAFGPDTADFHEETALLLAAGGACRVADEAGLTAFFRRLLAGDPQTLALGDRARAVVVRQAGAAGRSLALVRRALDGHR